MAQRAWKIASPSDLATAPPSADDHGLALAEVTHGGVIQRVCSFGARHWGWHEGERVPASLVEALGALAQDAVHTLPVAPGEWPLSAVPSSHGWLLVGYPATDYEPEFASTFKSLIENVALLVVRMNAEGTVLGIEGGEGYFLGSPAGAMVGQSLWQDVVHPEDRWKLTDALRRVTQHRHRATIRLRFLTSAHEVRLIRLYLLPPARPAAAEVDALLFDVTEQVDVEGILLQGEPLYRTFLEQSPMGVLYLDAAGVVTFENHAFREVVGEHADDAWIGRRIGTIEGLDVRFRSLVDRMLQDGEPLRGEVVALRHAGSDLPFHLMVHGSPIRQPGGQIVGGVMMVEDVTEHHRREEELWLRDRYEQAERALREAVLGDLNEDVFLHEAAAILGEAARADRIHVLVHLGDEGHCSTRAVWIRSERDEPFSLFVRSGDYPPLRRAVVDADGVYIRASDASADTQVLLELTEAEEVLWAPFYDSGRLGGFVLFERILPPVRGRSGFWQATEQHLMDHLVRLFETLWAWIQVGRRYRQTVASINDCLFTFSFSRTNLRRYLFVTPQIQTLTGYAADEILSREDAMPWTEQLVHPDDRDLVRAHDDALRSGRANRISYRILHKDGTTRWLREQATSHHDVPGRVMVSGVLMDVTEQKDAEEVLHNAEEQVRSASRLKSTFVATMSHELRTPLGAVNGFAELLALELAEWESQTGHALPPQVHEFTEAVRQNADRLLRLADDLFVLSNMEIGALRLDRSPVALHPIVQRCTHNLTVQLGKKDVAVEVDLDAQGAVVLGDAQRVEQVLCHLLSNAVKFTSQGAVTVRTRVGAGEVMLEVADTGVGIDPANMDTLFIPFLQGDSRLNRHYDGAGLGLALVKRLLDLMDGRIEVESDKGRGSTFRVFLPAGEEGKGKEEEGV